MLDTTACAGSPVYPSAWQHWYMLHTDDASWCEKKREVQRSKKILVLWSADMLVKKISNSDYSLINESVEIPNQMNMRWNHGGPINFISSLSKVICRKSTIRIINKGDGMDGMNHCSKQEGWIMHPMDWLEQCTWTDCRETNSFRLDTKATKFMNTLGIIISDLSRTPWKTCPLITL